jgi:hypothetical protein
MVIPPSLDEFGDQHSNLLVRTRPLYLQNLVDNGERMYR